MTKRSDFLLPNELGWACNDEISEMMIKKLQKLGDLGSMIDNPENQLQLLKVGVAEIIDSTYAIIKKYQEKE